MGIGSRAQSRQVLVHGGVLRVVAVGAAERRDDARRGEAGEVVHVAAGVVVVEGRA